MKKKDLQINKNGIVKSRARIELLNYLVLCSVHVYYGASYSAPSNKEKSFVSDGEPPIGGLIRLSAAPFSKWYLSWLKETRNNGNEFLLESIEDGSLCWWINVFISWYSPETVSMFPQWRWTDKQFEFNDKWHRSANRAGAYLVLSANCEFLEGYKVVLYTRVRFGLSNETDKKEFEDFRKVTVKQMQEFYYSAKQKHDEGVQLRSIRTTSP